MTNNWKIDAIAGLDGTQSRNQLNSDIKGLARNLDKLKLYAEIDKNQVTQLQNQLKKLQIDLNTVTVTDAAINGLVAKINAGLQNIQIGNINIGNVGSQAQQVGQQIGSAISQSVTNSVNGASQATDKILRDFSELNEVKRQFVDNHDLISKDDIADANKFYQTVREAFKEFGQVTISKGEMADGGLENLRVKIQQVNGELKTTREFMLYLNKSDQFGTQFRLADDDTIRTTERMVQHLNEVKNITNATGDEADALKQKLAEQAKYYENIKNETNHLYSLKQKLLSADELETAELNKQIKSTKQRITYNNQQLDKKGLRDNSLEREINDLVVAREKQLALSDAKAQDTANTKTQAQAQKEANAVLKEQQTLQEKVNKIQLLTNGGIKNDYSTQIATLEGNFRRLGLTQDEISQKTSRVAEAFGKLKTRVNEPFNESNYQEIINLNNILQRELIESSNEYTRLQASFRGFATEQQRLSLANTIEAWNQKNTKATRQVREENERYITTLRDLSVEMTKVNFDKINNGFKQNANSMRAMNRLGKSLKDQFTQAYQSFTMWLSASTLVMKVISETREAMTELKEVNTLLTEITKANDKLTKEQLSQIADNGFKTASKYGKSVTDYLSGVQEASRAGYENAEAIAELSVAIQGAGDVTEDVANSYVIATDKAYKLGGSVEALTEVFDGTNKITNLNAVNMSELAEAMTIVGSTAASFGVEVDETTSAIATMSAVTQQSGSEVARAFRAILLNIRQVSDEEEGIDAEGLTKYEKACNALGVSLKETKNGVLETRDAMDVLEELSEEYVKLDENDLRRTELLNSVGGKLRATQLDALLRNWDTYETMLQQYADGTGSMAREAEKTANSWEGSLKRLSNTWIDTVENVANSDTIIAIINGLNGVLSVVNEVTSALGSLGTISLGAGLFAGVKNFGKTYECMVSNFCFEYALHA